MPITYTLKRNSLTRHVKLNITHVGLTLIVPLRFNEKYIPDILAKHREWIEKQYHALELERKIRSILPTEIMLTAIDERWKIDYLQTTSQSIQLIQKPEQELALLGNIQDKQKCKKLLLDWLREKANFHLVNWLSKLSNETQLSFNNVQIRSQRHRWGSCSYAKNINLNDKLLFLPATLVSYVILHELCHTRELNHSSLFWQLLAKYDPQYKQHRAELRKAQQLYMPTWI